MFLFILLLLLVIKDTHYLWTIIQLIVGSLSGVMVPKAS